MRVEDHAIGHQLRADDADLQFVFGDQNDAVRRGFGAGAGGGWHHNERQSRVTGLCALRKIGQREFRVRCQNGGHLGGIDCRAATKGDDAVAGGTLEVAQCLVDRCAVRFPLALAIDLPREAGCSEGAVHAICQVEVFKVLIDHDENALPLACR